MLRCRVMVIREDGIWWGGRISLVSDREDAKIFEDVNDLLDNIRSYIMLATSSVTQIRIIGEV